MHTICKNPATGGGNTPQMPLTDNASKLAKQIWKSCLRCRFLEIMSSLPQELQVPAPPFTNAGIDLVGPIVKRWLIKGPRWRYGWWSFYALSVKAACMEFAPECSTKDFHNAYHSFTSQRGNPSFVHSDKGSQISATQKNITGYLLKFDWDVIRYEVSFFKCKSKSASATSSLGSRFDWSIAYIRQQNCCHIQNVRSLDREVSPLRIDKSTTYQDSRATDYLGK